MTKLEEQLQKYLDIYTSQETYFANDTRNLEFYKENPLNNKRDDIIQKLSVIDDSAFHQLNAQHAMADHILNLNIDSRLAQGDLSVVESIAKITLNGREENLLHAASQYCNLHRPDVFPIYSDQHMAFYKHYLLEHNLKISPDELKQYRVFVQVLNDVVDRYHLKGKLNYLQMRKFAWIYAEKVIEEGDPSNGN